MLRVKVPLPDITRLMAVVCALGLSFMFVVLLNDLAGGQPWLHQLSIVLAFASSFCALVILVGSLLPRSFWCLVCCGLSTKSTVSPGGFESTDLRRLNQPPILALH